MIKNRGAILCWLAALANLSNDRQATEGYLVELLSWVAFSDPTVRPFVG